MICLIQKQLDFVESIFSNVLTDGTGSFCNGVLHSLFNHRNGLMIKNCNDIVAFCEDACMYIERLIAYQ